MELGTMLEVVDVSFDFEANRYIKLGWKLISTYVRGGGDPREKNETLHYVLGFPAGIPQLCGEKTIPHPEPEPAI